MLPGLALLLLLGGAGLGFAYSTLENIQVNTQLLTHLAEASQPVQPLLEATQRLRTLLDLLVFTWGTSFALLGIGLYLQRTSRQQPNWDARLAQLMTTLEAQQKKNQTHLESLLTPLTTSSQEMANDIKQLIAHSETMRQTTTIHAIQNALAPVYTPSTAPHHPHHTPERLAIAGPAEIHDQEDENFEPF